MTSDSISRLLNELAPSGRLLRTVTLAFLVGWIMNTWFGPTGRISTLEAQVSRDSVRLDRQVAWSQSAFNRVDTTLTRLVLLSEASSRRECRRARADRLEWDLLIVSGVPCQLLLANNLSGYR